MVYRFKIVSDEVDNFCREIEIDSDANFLELRNAILDSVGYTKDEMSSFFLCDEAYSGFITGTTIAVDGGFNAYSGV